MGQKLLILASIILSLVFIAKMYEITNHALGHGERMNKWIIGIKDTAISDELAPYDNTVVTGDTVISVINKYQKGLSNGNKMSFLVDTVQYGHKAINPDGSWSSGSIKYVVYELKFGDVNYISPVVRYKANIVTNENAVVLGIKFEKE